MAITSNVKQTIPLTADGLAQKYVGTTATTITKARIMNVYGQASAADAEIKIYNEADSSKTASKLVYHVKFSNADNHGQSFVVPGEGIYCDAGMYVDLTNCDFCVIIGTFT
jgi:hypothetical protein|tara:strand:- start:99 stop:431 length:333 start_codon:yes stop_codon:yes gene_type:complete